MGGTVTAFLEDRIIAQGPRDEVTRAIESGWPADHGAVRVFDDESGRTVDLDLWDAAAIAAAQPAQRGRGRPKLGVTAREVTLLPRQWEWLGRQPGGASATLRRLVEAASKHRSPEAARDAVYRFVTAMAGDRPGYEDAIRALYRDDLDGFNSRVASWPEDIRTYASHLASKE